MRKQSDDTGKAKIQDQFAKNCFKVQKWKCFDDYREERTIDSDFQIYFRCKIINKYLANRIYIYTYITLKGIKLNYVLTKYVHDSLKKLILIWHHVLKIFNKYLIRLKYNKNDIIFHKS